MADLGRREINEVHVEAGHKLNASLLKAGLVDELLVYMAPLLVGQGRGMTALGPLESLCEAMQLTWLDITPIGPDLRLRARLR
jgi:diaminohydroxyphosphoribosylaminopyrimidine deaminase/5-amino-6-(5-phosphoribosylamino)uracil reductase